MVAVPLDTTGRRTLLGASERVATDVPARSIRVAPTAYGRTGPVDPT
jgi:hypothetical protein